MARRTYRGVFEREEDLVQAAKAVTAKGWQVVDIYSPYPLHDTMRILGLERSRLPRVAFIFGLLGLGLAFWFQFWASGESWPLNVGGRPWNSWPAFVPVAFEMMVLAGGLGLVLAWLVVCRLFPGEPAALPAARVTDDRFVLEVCAAGDADPEVIRELLRECHAAGVAESEGG
jgi:hypothetical protein